MNTEAISEKKAHYGRNVKRLREMLGIKQETLADELSLSQQTISRIESQEELDDDILNKIASVLHISVDAIKNYNDDIAVNIISNTFNEQSVAYQYNFNPIDKIIKLYDEKIELYERLLETEQDKNTLLEKFMSEKK